MTSLGLRLVHINVSQHDEEVYGITVMRLNGGI